jgi:hypothetical protein
LVQRKRGRDDLDAIERELKSVRIGYGLAGNRSRLGSCETICAAFGTTNPTDIFVRLEQLLSEIGDFPHMRALRSAYGLLPDNEASHNLTKRRHAVAELLGRDAYTIIKWENRAIRELAVRIQALTDSTELGDYSDDYYFPWDRRYAIEAWSSFADGERARRKSTGRMVEPIGAAKEIEGDLNQFIVLPKREYPAMLLRVVFSNYTAKWFPHNAKVSASPVRPTNANGQQLRSHPLRPYLKSSFYRKKSSSTVVALGARVAEPKVGWYYAVTWEWATYGPTPPEALRL